MPETQTCGQWLQEHGYKIVYDKSIDMNVAYFNGVEVYRNYGWWSCYYFCKDRIKE